MLPASNANVPRRNGYLGRLLGNWEDQPPLLFQYHI